MLKKNYNNGPVDDFVPHYQEISEVADTATETFLIGGERRVQALQIVRRENGSVIHQQRTLFPGDVLRKGKIYIGEKRRKSKLFRKTKVVTEKYLLCTDDADREILLPFDQKGLFYTLTTNYGDANHPVMQMSEVVNKRCFPCIVRLVYGRIPNTPCSFTGTLRLERADLEQSVIAATLVNKRNILLEIPTSCDLQFKVAVSSDELFRMPSYHQALELCNEKGSIYMRNIKVCYTITGNAQPIEVPDEEIAPVRRKLSMQLSCGTETSEDNSIDSPERANRMSDYVEMRSVKSDSLTEDSVDEDLSGFSLFSKELNQKDDNPPPCLCTRKFTNPAYIESNEEPQVKSSKESTPVLQIFLENKMISVDMKSNESSTDPSDYPTESKAAQKEPAPKPCIGCGSSFDSGIQMEPDGRRPSTVAFSEAGPCNDDEITYDVPRVHSRRQSAPPGSGTVSSSSEKDAAKEAFYRRPSTSVTLPSPRRPPPPLPRTPETPSDLTTIEFAIEEYDSEEEINEPVYQNITGSSCTLDIFGHLGGSPKLTPASSRCSSTRDSGHLSDECLPSRSSNNYDRDQLSPNIFQTTPIGDIPSLPLSRRNSSSRCTDDYQNSPMKIPALPGSKQIPGKFQCESLSLSNDSIDVCDINFMNDPSEENNNERKPLDTDSEQRESSPIITEKFSEVLKLSETDEKDVFCTEPYDERMVSDEMSEEPGSESSESITKERNYSVSSLQSLDVSDDNCEEKEFDKPKVEEKPVTRRYGSKIATSRKKSRQSKDISKMTAQELAVEFRRVGIKQQTIELVLSQDLNGIALLEKYKEHDSIRDFLPSAGIIDQQKISLFIQGCKY